MIGLAHTLPTPARAGPEPGPESQGGNRKAASAFFTESHEALKEMQECFPALRCGCLPALSQTSARTSTSRASASWSRLRTPRFRQARVRELAQLALKEYQEGTVKQEQATLEEVLALAQDELKHATRKIEQAIERNAKVQAALDRVRV